MASRSVTVLALIGAAMLIGVAALHGSGFAYVAGTIEDAPLPEFLKRILPPLYLYPSGLMALLAVVVFVFSGKRPGRPLALGLVCILVAANSILGFALGGPLPGGALLLVAGILGFAARAAREHAVTPGGSAGRDRNS